MQQQQMVATGQQPGQDQQGQDQQQGQQQGQASGFAPNEPQLSSQNLGGS
jgi:hypothetical protein